MFMKTLAILVIASVTCVPATSALAITGHDRAADPSDQGVEAPASGSLATYNGRIIDLSDGWGTATACRVEAKGNTTCFDTEQEMDTFISSNQIDTTASISTLRATCASDVRLYDAISYGVLVLSLGTRGSLISLAAYGFDNATTSYKIGACSSTFWDGVGAGSVYPGNTSAWAQSPNMVTGWNNRISSVYIY
jgi:hypothetical protein